MRPVSHHAEHALRHVSSVNNDGTFDELYDRSGLSSEDLKAGLNELQKRGLVRLAYVATDKGDRYWSEIPET